MLQTVSYSNSSNGLNIGSPGPAGEQLSYPSLANKHRVRSSSPRHNLIRNFLTTDQPLSPVVPGRDDLQIDYNLQQRNFSPLSQTSMGTRCSWRARHMCRIDSTTVYLFNIASLPAGIPSSKASSQVLRGMPYPSHTAHHVAG